MHAPSFHKVNQAFPYPCGDWVPSPPAGNPRAEQRRSTFNSPIAARLLDDTPIIFSVGTYLDLIGLLLGIIGLKVEIYFVFQGSGMSAARKRWILSCGAWRLHAWRIAQECNSRGKEGEHGRSVVLCVRQLMRSYLEEPLATVDKKVQRSNAPQETTPATTGTGGSSDRAQ